MMSWIAEPGALGVTVDAKKWGWRQNCYAACEQACLAETGGYPIVGYTTYCTAACYDDSGCAKLVDKPPPIDWTNPETYPETLPGPGPAPIPVPGATPTPSPSTPPNTAPKIPSGSPVASSGVKTARRSSSSAVPVLLLVGGAVLLAVIVGGAA